MSCFACFYLSSLCFLILLYITLAEKAYHKELEEKLLEKPSLAQRLPIAKIIPAVFQDHNYERNDEEALYVPAKAIVDSEDIDNMNSVTLGNEYIIIVMAISITLLCILIAVVIVGSVLIYVHCTKSRSASKENLLENTSQDIKKDREYKII